MNAKNRNKILFILAILILVAGISWMFIQKTNSPENVTSILPSSESAEKVAAGSKTYTSDAIGFSVVYPASYGEVELSINQADPNAVPPFNVMTNNPEGFMTIKNFKSFSGSFNGLSDKYSLFFNGGYVCWECDISAHTPEDFSNPQFEKFYTDTGDIGILTRGTLVPDPNEENSGYPFSSLKGNIKVSFLLPNDFRVISFTAKETPENIAVLRSIAIKK